MLSTAILLGSLMVKMVYSSCHGWGQGWVLMITVRKLLSVFMGIILISLPVLLTKQINYHRYKRDCQPG